MEDRWFVVNAAHQAARWVLRPGFGKRALLEPREARFSQVGIHLAVVGPGEHSTLYHAEESQEDFLVLRGSCTAIVQDGERLTGSPPGIRRKWRGPDLNRRHHGFQPCALPTELPRPAAGSLAAVAPCSLTRPWLRPEGP